MVDTDADFLKVLAEDVSAVAGRVHPVGHHLIGRALALGDVLCEVVRADAGCLGVSFNTHAVGWTLPLRVYVVEVVAVDHILGVLVGRSLKSAICREWWKILLPAFLVH